MYLVSVLVLVWYLWFRYSRRKINELAAKIPASPGLFVIVGAFQFAYNTSDFIFEIIKKCCTSAFKHGGIVRLWTGPRLYIGLTNPEDTEFVLKSCLEKEDLLVFMRSIVGNASAFAPVQLWPHRRKILTPSFSQKTIYSYMDMVSDESIELVKRLSLDNRIGTGEFSIWKYISVYTLSSLTGTALGLKLSALNDPDVPVIKAVLDIFHLLTHRMVHVWLWPNWLYKRTPQYVEFQKSVGVLYGLTDEIIKRKREEIHDLGVNGCLSNPGHERTHYLLDHLLTREHALTDLEIRDEISLLLLAGTDTSAIAICNTLKMLAKYPEVQEKIYAEIVNVVGDSDRYLHKDDLKELKYLDRVVKESLRLFPPVPIIARKANKEMTLPSGITLPEKTGIIIFVWGVNRDPNYWGANANCFDPDRFLSPNTNLLTTFSLGPRNCVGYQFAFIAIKIALTSILRRYKVVGEKEDGPEPKINSTFSIMLRDKDGCNIGLEKRR